MKQLSKKRNLISEILEKNKRNTKKGSRWEKVCKRSDSICDAFEFLRKQKKSTQKIELLKYIPIGIVTCIEGFFRIAIKELIDKGNPFLNNIKKFDYSFDIQTIVDSYNNKITIGELISHIISISSLEQIQKCMSEIIGDDFKKILINTKIPQIKNYENWDTLISLNINVFESVSRIFELRHTFAHELATIININEKELFEHFTNTIIFLLVSDQLITNLLQKNKF